MDELLDGYRAALRGSVDGLDDEQARRRLVRSKTTLLGLVKHVTDVEGVWFDQAVTGRSYREIGTASTPGQSFTLTRADTIASVLDAHAERCDASRRTMAALALDDIVDGRGERTVWALYLQVQRAQTVRRAPCAVQCECPIWAWCRCDSPPPRPPRRRGWTTRPRRRGTCGSCGLIGYSFGSVCCFCRCGIGFR
ncbi:DUF664 domain-containing protein [Rhodococcus sp. NPDC127530]|uniref:mycothiol transferase n=1 Tax=unclassified Rhodococcus (in: high G+C Gram-positive bacteria) TaxID=192944 RepID=UPI0036351515